nr:ATP synthase F0 subunit 8 [Tegrodera latecincta]
MPQMAPLNWLNLLIFFVMIFMLSNSLNFYSFMYKSKEKEQQKNKIKMNWKWL